METQFKSLVFLSLILLSTAEQNLTNKGSTQQHQHQQQQQQLIDNVKQDGVLHATEKRSVTFQTDDKRGVMGFHGMRGKKDEVVSDDLRPDDQMDDFYDKRGSNLGFHGMRGKKYDDYQFEDKRNIMGFHGMRGKKDYDEDYVDKRAPNMGFQGVRGKKDDMDDLYKPIDDSYLLSSGFYNDDDFNKRSIMGFHGMRGKKESDFNFKRAMGFLGMRGKKNDIWDSQNFDKKAPNSGFFGMRGKKDDDVDDLEELLTYLKSTEKSLDRSRRAAKWLRNSKKAKTGFFGVRGKKSGGLAELQSLTLDK